MTERGEGLTHSSVAVHREVMSTKQRTSGVAAWTPRIGMGHQVPSLRRNTSLFFSKISPASV
jgi:hypothetical protein